LKKKKKKKKKDRVRKAHPNTKSTKKEKLRNNRETDMDS